MNKKILISLSVIAAVAAIVVGGTIAYFSDTETSSGNLFAAGSIDLKIDNESYLNGVLSTSTSWSLKDLAGELFFNFTDLKPGDNGEDTVSLHVYNNDAWACAAFCNLVSDDEDCVEPEEEDEGSPCDADGEGELAENLYFVFWADDGDNVYEGEQILMSGWADSIIPEQNYTLAAPAYTNVFTGVVGEPLEGSTTYYIGKAWCFGEIDWYEFEMNGNIVCDGSNVDNAPQTDSLTGNIIFYAEQERNNSGFVCPDLCE